MKVMLTVFIILSLISLEVSASCARRCNPSPCARTCSQYETRCECTDPNAYNNYCLSPAKFCEAFGNVGAR